MYLKFQAFKNPQNTSLITLLFFWAPAAMKENSDEFLQGKFVAWSFDFSSKRQLSIFFQLVICIFNWCILNRRGEKVCLNFLSVHQRANGRWSKHHDQYQESDNCETNDKTKPFIHIIHDD